MATKIIKYQNGIEVAITTHTKWNDILREDSIYSRYEVSYGNRIFQTNSFEKAKEEFNKISYELSCKKIKEDKEKEFLNKEVSEWKKEFPNSVEQ